MNNTLFIPALLMTAVSTLGLRAFAEAPQLVRAPLENVFTPLGFDDNDNVEIVVHGHFTNSCTKVGPISAQVDEATHTIVVRALSWRYDHPLCDAEEMYTPFTQSAQLGLLKEGTYRVSVESSELQVSPLVVAKAHNPLPDDYMYAPVDQISVHEDASTRQQVVTLRGEFEPIPRGCLVLKRVDASVSGSHVIVVQPIVEVSDVNCPSTRYPFETSFTLPQFFSGRYLFHVRVLNGQSLNKVYDLGQ